MYPAGPSESCTVIIRLYDINIIQMSWLQQVELWPLSKHGAFTQCCFNVGPPSRRWPNIETAMNESPLFAGLGWAYRSNIGYSLPECYGNIFNNVIELAYFSWEKHTGAGGYAQIYSCPVIFYISIWRLDAFVLRIFSIVNLLIFL